MDGSPAKLTPEALLWNRRRRALYERLMDDKDFVEMELHGRMQETVDDELDKMRQAKDPVALWAARDCWLLAEELRGHIEKTLANYRADETREAEAAKRRADGLPPEDSNE